VSRAVRTEVRPYDDPVASGLVAEVQAEYLMRYGGMDRSAVDPAEFAPPRGLFLVGWLDGAAVACGGWRAHPEPVAGRAAVEVKRMYVAAGARRCGLASRLLAELESTAAAAGFGYVVLSTGNRQPEAIALYQERGYHAVPPFGTYASSASAWFFGKSL